MPKKSFRKGSGKNKGGKTRKQKMYNMKGCSKSKRMSGGRGCGAFGCPIAPYAFKSKGGCAGQCPVGGQNGGNFYKPPAPIPGPFVGTSWTPSIRGWPGVNGISSDNNYLAQNLYDHGDPQTMMKLGGSKQSKIGKKKYQITKGGGLVPQDLVNLGRDMSFNFKSAYNALNGYAAPTNPLPYRDQLSRDSSNKLIL
jgi:hypothetical protein